MSAWGFRKRKLAGFEDQGDPWSSENWMLNVRGEKLHFWEDNS